MTITRTGAEAGVGDGTTRAPCSALGRDDDSQLDALRATASRGTDVQREDQHPRPRRAQLLRLLQTEHDDTAARADHLREQIERLATNPAGTEARLAEPAATREVIDGLTPPGHTTAPAPAATATVYQRIATVFTSHSGKVFHVRDLHEQHLDLPTDEPSVNVTRSRRDDCHRSGLSTALALTWASRRPDAGQLTEAVGTAAEPFSWRHRVRPVPGRDHGERTMPFVTTGDGVEIFCKGRGSGRPVMFHHGWPLSSDDGDARLLFLVPPSS